MLALVVERPPTRVPAKTVLGELPIPSLEEINSEPQFHAEEITQADFDAVWLDRGQT